MIAQADKVMTRQAPSQSAREDPLIDRLRDERDWARPGEVYQDVRAQLSGRASQEYVSQVEPMFQQFQFGAMDNGSVSVADYHRGRLATRIGPAVIGEDVMFSARSPSGVNVGMVRVCGAAAQAAPVPVVRVALPRAAPGEHIL